MHTKTIRLLTCLGILLFALSLVGCRICNSNEDLDYPTYGGAWQRTLRNSGRVGSVFDPAGAKVAVLSARETPHSEDEIERARPENQEDPDDRDDELEREDEDDPDLDRPDDEESNGKGEDWDGRDLEDLDNDDADSLEDLKLEDIEVRIVPGKPPVMIHTK